jgi:hypothetical protein
MKRGSESRKEAVSPMSSYFHFQLGLFVRLQGVGTLMMLV